MIRSSVRLGLMFALLAPCFVAGCSDPKDKQIAELQSETDRLRNELNDKDARLARMMSEQGSTPISGSSAADQDTIRSLNSELAALRDRLRDAESKSKTPIIDGGDGKWVSMPGFDMLTLQGEVLFDSGKATLKPGGKSTLDRIAGEIRSRFPDREIYVVGHTDNDPIRKSGWKDNWELGAQRSLATVRYLAQAGISPGKLIQANRGEYSPRADGNAQTSKAKNRRVQFYAVVKPGLSSTETADVSPRS